MYVVCMCYSKCDMLVDSTKVSIFLVRRCNFGTSTATEWKPWSKMAVIVELEDSLATLECNVRSCDSYWLDVLFKKTQTRFHLMCVCVFVCGEWKGVKETLAAKPTKLHILKSEPFPYDVRLTSSSQPAITSLFCSIFVILLFVHRHHWRNTIIPLCCFCLPIFILYVRMHTGWLDRLSPNTVNLGKKFIDFIAVGYLIFKADFPFFGLNRLERWKMLVSVRFHEEPRSFRILYKW